MTDAVQSFLLDLNVIKDVAGASVFLACKVEESGRKLKDVAAVCQSKASGVLPNPNAGENDPVRNGSVSVTELEGLC